VKHGGTNVIVDAIFIDLYYVHFDKCKFLIVIQEGEAES
jgi:hypothetical protein